MFIGIPQVSNTYLGCLNEPPQSVSVYSKHRTIGTSRHGLQQLESPDYFKKLGSFESPSNAESPCSTEKGVQGNPAAYKKASHGGDMIRLHPTYIHVLFSEITQQSLSNISLPHEGLPIFFEHVFL